MSKIETFWIENGEDGYPATLLNYNYDDGTYALVQEGVDQVKPDVIAFDAQMLANFINIIQEIKDCRVIERGVDDHTYE